MYYLLKIQQLSLGVLFSVLLGIILYPPHSSGGIDLQQPDGVLMMKNSSQRLIGTAVSRGDPADNFAVIEDMKTKRQWIYREGDMVGTTTLIKKIQPDQIIIYNGSVEEVVKLQRSLTAGAAGGMGSATASAVKARQDPNQKNGPRDKYYLINGEVFASAFANPGQLLETADMQAGKLFGQQKGVRLGDFAPDSIFTALGLRKRDLLLAVDGQYLSDPGQALAMLQTMLADGQAELKVRRRARTYRFHLQAD